MTEAAKKAAIEIDQSYRGARSLNEDYVVGWAMNRINQSISEHNQDALRLAEAVLAYYEHGRGTVVYLTNIARKVQGE